MDTLQYKLVTTRKPHTCFLCLRKFEPNTKMFYWTCVDSGQINSGYTCKTCESITFLLEDYETQEMYKGDILRMLEKGQTPEQYLEELKNKKR